MSVYSQAMHYLQTPEAVATFEKLYGAGDGMLSRQMSRYRQLVKAHMKLFDSPGPLTLFSTPGRTEISGNHTDHQNGRVMAAAVSLDIIAAVSPRTDMTINLQSEGYPLVTVRLDQLVPLKEEQGTTAALVRGVAAGLSAMERPVGGFDCMVMSDVMRGSGLSSSAAFEVLICLIMDTLYPGREPLDPVLRAKISQYAENEFFMKPSGLMDQMACSLGGLSMIDFKNADPVVETIQYSFEKMGYQLAVVDTRGSHDSLTGEYAAIREEMTAVARYFGETTLRRVGKEQIMMDLANLRRQTGDRAVLRALHCLNENKRVLEVRDCLKNGDLNGFFNCILASGKSSWTMLQNISASPREQPIALALALAEDLLAGRGAWRVHGGGFAGTTLNFVPIDLMPAFVSRMESAFGPGCCYRLNVRPEGPIALCTATV